MSKEDYRDKIEEHRQSINIEKPNSRQSRSRIAKTKNPKRRDPLMTILTVIFIFIPLVILVYVWGFYSPTTPSQAQGNEESESVEYAKNEKIEDNDPINDEPVLIDDTVDENKEKDDKSEDVKQDSKQNNKNEESKQDDPKEDEQITKEKTSTETENNGQAKDKQTSEDNVQLKENKHKVKSGDTLYSIAVGNNTTVDAIMEANGLSTPDIRVDQILLIP